MHSLSVLLSAVETSRTTSLVTVIRNCVRVPRILAAATIRGRRLFCSELPIVRLLFKGGDYSRVASIQRNTVAIYQ